MKAERSTEKASVGFVVVLDGFGFFFTSAFEVMQVVLKEAEG